MVSKSKINGGLGVKSMHTWNKAAHTRHIWDLVQEKPLLWANWVIIYKLRNLSFWGLTKPMNSSWSWRQLLNLWSEIRNCFNYKLGDGNKFSFWFDP